MYQLCPSILSADFNRLGEQIKILENEGVEWLHIDVMDGHFVPNISFGYSILKDVSKVTSLFLDVHLMISEPQKYVDEFIKNVGQAYKDAIGYEASFYVASIGNGPTEL